MSKQLVRMVIVNGRWRVFGLATYAWGQVRFGPTEMTALPGLVLLIDGEGHGRTARVVGATLTIAAPPAGQDGEAFTLVSMSQVLEMELEIEGE